MDDDVKTDEIKKTRVFSPWVIFHSINLVVAFFWYAFLNPLSDERWQVIRPGGRIFGALGGFTLMMFIPWLSALIHRLLKKQPSTSVHFFIYYIILFLWIINIVTIDIIHHSKSNLDFWSKFEDNSRIGLFFSSLLILIIFFVIRLLIVKANKYEPTKVNLAHNPDLKPTINPGISRKQKEKRLLLILLGFVLFIILAIVLKELSS
jgi:hypothetical protein